MALRDPITAPTTPQLDAATCPHGKRAGITVCLYCRQEARVAARRRRNRMLMRAGGIVVGVGSVVAVLVATLVAIAPWSRSNLPEAAEVTQPATKATSTKPSPRSATPARPPSVLPVVAEGRTDLGDSVYAERLGAEVVVRFDNSLLRTRFDEKFERTVRGTLPRVFGSGASDALDQVAPGALVRGDLLRELPVRGIPLALAGGGTLLVYPVTRPGQDGPIVVAYRALARP